MKAICSEVNMTALYISLPGDPAWWQAFAGVAQVLLALAIFWVTRKYVNLTGDMVKLQADVLDRQKYGADYRADLDLIFANPDGTPLRPDSVSGVSNGSQSTIRGSSGLKPQGFTGFASCLTTGLCYTLMAS
jgi:hypothetical protein